MDIIFYSSGIAMDTRKKASSSGPRFTVSSRARATATMGNLSRQNREKHMLQLGATTLQTAMAFWCFSARFTRVDKCLKRFFCGLSSIPEPDGPRHPLAGVAGTLAITKLHCTVSSFHVARQPLVNAFDRRPGKTELANHQQRL